MLRFLAGGLALLILLSGCGEDVNPVIGEWRGEISDAQREGLSLPKGEMDGVLVAAFSKTIATLNGRIYRVEHKKNEGTYYVNEIGTNRTMAVRFTEPNRVELGIPHRFRTEIVVLFMTRVANSQ
jgi:hypothetical protein